MRRALVLLVAAACGGGRGGDDVVKALAASDDPLDAAYAAIIADPKAAVPIFEALDRKPKPGDKAPFEHDPAKRRAAEDKRGAALVPAMLAVAQMTDHPDAARDALDYLGEHAVVAARPIALAALASAAASASAAVRASALRVLRALGPDPATADALYTYAMAPAATEDRSAALEVYAAVEPGADAAKQVHLIQRAEAETSGSTPNEAFGRAYLMVGDGAVGWSNPIDGMEDDAAAARAVRTCGDGVDCLAALVETGADRAYDKMAVDKALRTLALHPEPAARGPLLAALDELEDPRVFDEVIAWLPFAIPGSCPECVSRMTAAVARHAKSGVWQHTEIARAIDRFRAHGTVDGAPAGDVHGGAVDVLAGEHRAIARDASAHAIAADLFAPTAIGIGAAASEVAIGAAPVRALMERDFTTPMHFEGTVRSHRGGLGDIVWDSQMLLFDDAMAFGHLTQVIVDGKLRLFVYSHGVEAATATAAAKAGKLPRGAPLLASTSGSGSAPAAGSATANDAEIAALATTMLASTTAFAAALSADAYVMGAEPTAEANGPGEIAKVLPGGGAVTVRDVHAERLAKDIAVAVANVERAGAPMRVALVLARPADGGWLIVQAQWSYGLPIPGVQ